MLDASSDGELSSKTCEEGYKFIESISDNTYQWPLTRVALIGVSKKPVGVHEVIETINLAAQVEQIH